MMANTSRPEYRINFFLLLVASGLSILPPASCQYCNTKAGEPLINISSTPTSDNFPIGSTINLTCTAWQTDELAMKNPKTRPHRIEWFDPQDERAVKVCPAESPAAALMNCTLMVGALKEKNFGNYTCKASNGYNYCSNKRLPISLQDIQRPDVNQSSYVRSTVTFNGTVFGQSKPTATWTETDSYSKQSNPRTTDVTADGKSLGSALNSYWFIVLILPVVIGQM
ncbi:uncharacterized protein LOC144633644 [Oculina patagonica]